MASSSYSPSPAELRIITHNIPRSAPNDALYVIISKNKKQKAIERAKNQQITLLQQTGNDFINHLLFHPKYLLPKIFSLPQQFEIPIHFIHMLWYLASAYTIALEIDTVPLKISIKHFREQPLHRPAYQTLINLLTWFQPLQVWDRILTDKWKKLKGPRSSNFKTVIPISDNLILPSERFTVFFLSLNPHYSKTLRAVQLYPSAEIYDSSGAFLHNNIECSRPI